MILTSCNIIRSNKATASIGAFWGLVVSNIKFSKAVVTLDQMDVGSASVVGYAALKKVCKGNGQNVIWKYVPVGPKVYAWIPEPSLVHSVYCLFVSSWLMSKIVSIVSNRLQESSWADLDATGPYHYQSGFLKKSDTCIETDHSKTSEFIDN